MKDKIQKMKYIIFYINFLFDNTDNIKEEKKYILNKYYNILSIIYNKYDPLLNNLNILNEKFLNCKFISKKEKRKIKLYYNSLLN